MRILGFLLVDWVFMSLNRQRSLSFVRQLSLSCASSRHRFEGILCRDKIGKRLCLSRGASILCRQTRKIGCPAPQTESKRQRQRVWAEFKTSGDLGDKNDPKQ